MDASVTTEQNRGGTPWADLAAAARARSQVYGFLVTAFRDEPQEPVIRELKGPNWSLVLSSLGIPLGEAFFSRSEEQLVEDLAVEFARLFLGPQGHLSPHASVHKAEECGGGGGMLWGEETVRVKRFIEATGLTFAKEYRGFPDHISVELEFLQKATEEEAQAWKEERTEDAMILRGMEQKFHEKHVLSWVPGFCDKIIERTTEDFYVAIAEVTKIFLEIEKDNLKSIPNLQGA
jgi:TorA maturation chaperone TorD